MHCSLQEPISARTYIRHISKFQPRSWDGFTIKYLHLQLKMWKQTWSMGPVPALLQEDSVHWVLGDLCVSETHQRKTTSDRICLHICHWDIILLCDILLPSLENRIARIKSAITFSLHPKHHPSPQPPPTTPPSHPFTCPLLFWREFGYQTLSI